MKKQFGPLTGELSTQTRNGEPVAVCTVTCGDFSALLPDALRSDKLLYQWEWARTHTLTDTELQALAAIERWAASEGFDSFTDAPAQPSNSAPVLPVVNINGTSVDELMTQRVDAWIALRKACTALANMAPHGRDYQTAPPGTYDAARRQHDERVRSLGLLIDSIQAETDALADHPSRKR